MLEIQTAAVNNPDFIELQSLLFQKFIAGDYRFKVFNHAKDYPDCSNYFDLSNDFKNKITRICERINIPCEDVVDTPWYKGNPSSGTASAMNYLLKTHHMPKPGKYLVIDSDMFLINKMDSSHFDDCDASYRTIRRNKYEYMWNGIYYFNTEQMKGLDLLDWRQFKYTENNPDPGCGLWTDTGGLTHKWVSQEAPNHTVRLMNEKMLISGQWSAKTAPSTFPKKVLEFCELDPRKHPGGEFYSELYEDLFFHYRAGGNWDKRSQSLHKLNALNMKTLIFDLLHYQ